MIKLIIYFERQNFRHCFRTNNNKHACLRLPLRPCPLFLAFNNNIVHLRLSTCKIKFKKQKKCEN